MAKVQRRYHGPSNKKIRDFYGGRDKRLVITVDNMDQYHKECRARTQRVIETGFWHPYVEICSPKELKRIAGKHGESIIL